MVVTVKLRKKNSQLVHLAFVLLVPHPEFDVRVAQAVVVHGLKAATLDQTDADDTSPQLGFSVHVRQTHALILQQAHTHTFKDTFTHTLTHTHRLRSFFLKMPVEEHNVLKLLGV